MKKNKIQLNTIQQQKIPVPLIDGVGQSAVILNFIMGFVWSLTIVGLIIAIPTFRSNKVYLYSAEQKTKAMLFGFLTSFVGGIFILFSQPIDDIKFRKQIEMTQKHKKNKKNKR